MSPDRRRALRWLLLCALAIGLIGMHHVAADDTVHESPTHTVSPAAAVSGAEIGFLGSSEGAADDRAHEPSVPGGGHDHLLHLCLAVLAAAAVAALLRALRWRTATGTGWGRRSPLGDQPVQPRPPPCRDSDILTSLCVLRV